MDGYALAGVKVKHSWTLIKGVKNKFYSVTIAVGERTELDSNWH